MCNLLYLISSYICEIHQFFLGIKLLGHRNLCLALVDIVKQFSKVVGLIYIPTSNV